MLINWKYILELRICCVMLLCRALVSAGCGESRVYTVDENVLRCAHSDGSVSQIAVLSEHLITVKVSNSSQYM